LAAWIAESLGAASEPTLLTIMATLIELARVRSAADRTGPHVL